MDLGRDASLSEPFAIAVDASGNLWFSNSSATSNTLTEILGIANPVKVPMFGPTQQP